MNFPPKLIIVSDEIFTMPDVELNQPARLVVPFYYNGGLLGRGVRNDRTGFSVNPYSRSMPNEILATDHAVQSNVFNNELEHQDVTVHDYLNKFSHDIITFKMCDKILDIWHSQKVEWHIERGIKL